MKRIVHAFVSAVQRNPVTTLVICLALGVVAALLIARLRLSSDITNLFPPDTPEVSRFRLVAETFDLADTLLIIISKNTPPGAPDTTTAELRRFGNLLWADLFPDNAKDDNGKKKHPGAGPAAAAADAGTAYFRPPMQVELAEQVGKTLASHGMMFLKDEDFDGLIAKLDAAGIEELVAKSAARLAISPPMPGSGLRAKDVLGIAELLVKAAAVLTPLATQVGSDADLAAVSDNPLSGLLTTTSSPAGDGGVSAIREAPFSVSGDGACLLLRLEGTAHARNTEFSKTLLARVAEAESAARREYARLGRDPSRIAVHMMGGYVTAAENEQSMRHDISLTITTGAIGVSLILLLFLRTFRGVFTMLTPLAFAVLWTFGLASAAFTPLNTVTLAFAAILAGLGIDLSIHLYLRHASETARTPGGNGAGATDATTRTYIETGYGVLFATLTTVGAFAALAASSFPGVRRMSLLVASGMVLTLLANYTVLPALISLLGKSRGGIRVAAARERFVVAPPSARRQDERLEDEPATNANGSRASLLQTQPGRGPVARLVRAICDRPVLVLSLAAVLAAVGICGTAHLRFETDPQRLVHSSEATARARTVLHLAFPGFAEPVLVLHSGSTEEAVLAESRKFASWLDRSRLAGRIRARFALGELVPDSAVQAARLAKLASIDPDAVGRALVDSLERHGFNSESFNDYIGWVKGLLSVRAPLILRDLGEAFGGRFIRHSSGAGGGTTSDPGEAGTEPDSGKRGLDESVLGLSLVWPGQGESGIARRRAFPRDLSAELERARVRYKLAELERTGERLPHSTTGMPVERPPDAVPVGFELMMDVLEKLVYSETWLITALAAACVFALVLLQFRCLWFALAALIPVTVGLLAGGGIIYSLGLKLNFLSVAFFPIIVGIGVDDGIHMVHRFRGALKEGGGGKDGGDHRRAIEQVTNDAGLGVVLTSLTTIAGFGSLALAENPLLVSLGVVVSVGVAACLVASLTVLPAVLFVCKRNRRLV